MNLRIVEKITDNQLNRECGSKNESRAGDRGAKREKIYVPKKKYIFQKGAVCVALFLWMLSAAKVLWNGWEIVGKQQMISAFGSSVYSNMTANISTYGKYGDINLTTGAKKIILENIADQIGIDKYEILEREEDGKSVLELTQNSVNGNVVCRFITDSGMSGSDSEQYIYISVTLKENIKSAFTYEEIVRNIAQELQMTSNVTVNLKGEVAGKLDIGVRNIVADKLLSSIGAKIVEENREEELYTIYAYNREIKEHVQLGSQKVNVNVTMYYDELRDVTCINLSTPISNEDY